MTITAFLQKGQWAVNTTAVLTEIHTHAEPRITRPLGLLGKILLLYWIVRLSITAHQTDTVLL